MTRFKHSRKSKKNKIFVFSMVGILLFMCIGYAAFETQISINAKGNVIKKLSASEILLQDLVSSGDGLYIDNFEEGRYVFKGATPNNYITFNNELWRIISLESDGTIKIIKDDSIGKISWDAAGTRDSSTSTYCTNASTYGCDAWAATNHIIGTPSLFIAYSPNGNPDTDTTTYTGTVIKDASLNTYLNEEYFNTLGNDKDYIDNHNFNIGSPGTRTDTEDLSSDIAQEKSYIWTGKIGLITVTDYLRATTNTECTSLYAAYNNTTNCATNNWLIDSEYVWTISHYVYTTRYRVWYINSNGSLLYGSAFDTNYVRPAVYLKSDISLKGDGTADDSYKIY